MSSPGQKKLHHGQPNFLFFSMSHLSKNCFQISHHLFYLFFMSHQKEIIIEKVTLKCLICSDSTPISINVCRVTPSRKNAYRCHTEQKKCFLVSLGTPVVLSLPWFLFPSMRSTTSKRSTNKALPV